jgi:hypothetical protein
VAGVLLERPHLERQRGLHGRVVLPPAVQLFARRPGDSAVRTPAQNEACGLPPATNAATRLG